MTCAESDRGKIHNIARYRQPVCFNGLKYGRITPTDVDGYIEYRNKVFVFYELKLRGTPIQKGQNDALCHLVDGLRLSNKHAVLFKCEHDVSDCDEQVDADKAEVTEVYINREWKKQSIKRTARQATDTFFEYLKEHYGEETPLNEEISLGG